MAASGKRFLVELYYDVFSPYSFFSFEVLCRYREPWNMDLKLKPFLLSAIMRESGNRPPGMLPGKAIYLSKDLKRLSEFNQVKLKMFPEFMDLVVNASTLKSQRFLCAVQLHNPEYLEAVTRKLYERLFVENKENMSVESIVAAAEQATLPSDVIQKCLSAIENEDVKSILKTHTDEALEHNAFGAPTIIAHINGKKEVFFGHDRLELMAHMAGKKYLGPVPNASKL